MLANYGYIGLFLIIAILFAVGTILLPYLLSLPSRLRNHPYLFNFLPSLLNRFSRIVPHRPNPIKGSTYECGMETVGKSWVQFNFRYYFYALLFIVLDVLVVFLYPWAVNLRQLEGFGFIGIIIFIFIIVVGYIYAWRKKVLEWK